MSEKTLLKKIDQAFAENYCTGSYKLELQHDYDEDTYYVLYYTYKTGETIAVDIDVTLLGEVKFYSPVHGYYISNFNNHIKSVINVLRMLFDLIESNKDTMIKYNEIETEESEETVKDVMEVKQKLNAQFGKEIFELSELDVMGCIMCPADRKGNYCAGRYYCKQTWKRYSAIVNPEWHHVSLATLANIDFDMLDEKRKTYLLAYRDLKQTISYLRKCKTIDTYDRCHVNYIKKQNDMCTKGKITIAMLNFIRSKLSMQNVESGVWASDCENSTGFHKSKRYNKSRIDL